MAVDGLGQADAPERRGAPFTAVGTRLPAGCRPGLRPCRAAAGRCRARSVGRLLGVGDAFLLGDVLRAVAGDAAALVELLLAAQHGDGSSMSRRAGTARFPRIEENFVHDFGAGFEAIMCAFALAVARSTAGVLALGVQSPNGRSRKAGWRCRCRRPWRRYSADAASGCRPSSRSGRAGSFCLPCSSAPDPIGPAGDAVAIGVLGIGLGQNVVLGDRLQEAEADHRLGDPRRQHGRRGAAGRSRGPSMTE